MHEPVGMATGAEVISAVGEAGIGDLLHELHVKGHDSATATLLVQRFYVSLVPAH